MVRLAAAHSGGISPLERALNYPKSRPAGGGFAPCRRDVRPVCEKPDVLVMAE